MPCQVPNAATTGSWGDKERAGEISGPILSLAIQVLIEHRVARGAKARWDLTWE